MSKKLLTIIMILCMVLGTGTFAYADVIPDYTGTDTLETVSEEASDETLPSADPEENLIGEEETVEQGGSLSEEAYLAVEGYEIYVGGNGASDSNFGNNPADPYASLDKAVENVETGGTIYVQGDLELSSTISITGKAITITSRDDGPYTITRGSGVKGNLITVGSGAGLTLENITLDGNKDVIDSAGGSLVYVDGGTFTMSGGTISGNKTTYGGGVYVSSGTFTMDGGTISGNEATKDSGGVRVRNGTFTMNGGTISGNTTSTKCGGVSVSGGTFTMTGGTISGNKANYGGGVYVISEGTFKLSGSASITGNTKTDGTGANNVYLSSGKTITLTGALTDGAKIGVTTADTPTPSSPVTIAQGSGYTVGAKDRAKFTSDGGYYAILNSSAIKLSTTLPSLTSITIPQAKSLTYTYNGEEQTGFDAAAADAGYTFKAGSELVGTNAGTYTVTAVLDNDETTMWADGTGVHKELTWEIEKKTPELGDFDITGIGNKVYDGAAADVKVELKNTYEGAGAITVKYYKDGEEVPKADTKNVGTYTVKFAVAEGANFKATETEIEAGGFKVSPKSVTITGTTVAEKVYDGTTAATVENAGTVTAGDVVSGDTVNVKAGTAVFTDKNVGEDKTVTLTGFALEGADAGNYELSAQPTGVTGEITAKPLTITATDKESRIGKEPVALTYTSEPVALATGDTFDGNLALAENFNKDTADNYDILQGTLTVSDGNNGANYAITFNKGTYKVLEKEEQTIAFAEATVTKTYGDAAFKVEVKSDSIKDNANVTYAGEAGKENVATVEADGTVTIKGAGKITITATAAETADYAEGTATYTLKVDKKSVTITGTTVEEKVYDGTKTADINYAGDVNGKVGDEDVTVSKTGATATFENKNVGENKAVTIEGLTLEGAAAANYELSKQPEGVTGTITAKSVTITGVTVEEKVYDGTTAATVENGGTVADVVSGDTVTVKTGTATFADKNVGEGKTVNLAGFAIEGADAGNYQLSAQPTGVTGTITAKSVTITGVTVEEKVYDGTTAATVENAGTVTAGDVVSGDTVNVKAGTAVFTDKNVGTGKTVTLTGFELEGEDAGNYELSAQPEGVTGTITAKPVTITGTTVEEKTYDGTTAATVENAGEVNGKVGDDDVTVSETGATATFENKNAGENKPVTITGLTLTGTAAGNYQLSAQPTGVKGTITAKPLTITAADKQSRKGQNQVALTYTSEPATLATGDTFDGSLALAENFNKDAAGDYDILQGSLKVIDGNNGANYAITFNKGTYKVLEKEAQTIAFAEETVTKTYGDAAFKVEVKADSIKDNANVTYAGEVGKESVATVGTDGTVTIKGAGEITITATAAETTDYAEGTATYTLKVDKKSVTITNVTVKEKVYDGTTAATVENAGEVNGKEGSDDVTVSKTGATATFENKNVGENKAVTIEGLTLEGAAAGNYELSKQPEGVTGKITAKPVTITGVTVEEKVYDGTTAATVENAGTVTAGDVVSGDTVTVKAGTAVFTDKNVGTDKTVTLTGFELEGADAGNYVLSAQSTGVTGTITAKPLTITAADKQSRKGKEPVALTYTSEPVALATGDTFDGNLALAENFNKDTADNYDILQGTLTVSDGNNGANYAITFNKGTYKVLEKEEQTIAFAEATVTKTYGDAAFKVEVLSESIKDNATVTYAGETGKENVATVAADGTVTIKGAGEITITATAAATADYAEGTATYTLKVDKKSVTITGTTVEEKVYDGTTAATVENAGTVADVVTGDTLTVKAGTAVFADKNVGTGKTVTLTGFELEGAAAGNYVLSAQPEGVTGTITAKSVTITGVTVEEKVYDGTTAATVENAGTVTAGDVVSGDTVTVKAGTAVFTDKNVGTDKTVTLTGFELEGADAGNYVLSAQSTGVTGTITKKPITITAENKQSRVGKELVELKYTYNENDLVSGDSFTGAPATTANKDTVGVSDITQGTLSLGDNYDITFINGKYTVTAKDAQTIAFAEATVTKTYGDAAFTNAATGPADGGAITYSSDNTDVATVDENTGEVTILKVGQANIVATAAATADYEEGTATYTLTVNKKTASGGGYVRFTQSPTIETAEGAKVTLSTDGTTATITAAEGYEITDVTVNGVSKGAVTAVSGLRTGDKLAVTTARKAGYLTEEEQKKADTITGFKIIAKSKQTKLRNGKKAIRITWNTSEYQFDGVEVWRSTKRYSGYGKKPVWTIKAQNTKYYYNTAIKTGKTYYYKLRGYVEINGTKYYTSFSTKAYRTVK